jgi:hypothetical protein
LITRSFATYLTFWLVLMILGVANGIVRELTYGRRLSELRAHQLSTLTGVLVMTLAVWLLSLFIRPSSMEMALLIGLIWLALTVAFEFGFGHWVARHTWEELLADYNMLRGRLWPLFLLWMLLLPGLVYLVT